MNIHINKTKLLILILLHILLLLIIRLIILNYNNSTIETYSQHSDNILSNRLERLEPIEPVNIDDPPFYYRNHFYTQQTLPSKTFPISEVFSSGSEIPLQFIYNNLEWKRQAYKDYWHSTVSGGRWSYVPDRIHYAMHRIFSTYPTSSIYYDFRNNLGIWDESLDFDISYTKSLSTPYDFIHLVIMQTDVQKVILYGNQIVIVGKPQLTGLQSIIIPTKDINPINDDKNLLIQLVTPEGDIIDYTTNIIKDINNTK